MANQDSVSTGISDQVQTARRTEHFFALSRLIADCGGTVGSSAVSLN
ncbi:MAG: hypothetical protein OFPII_41150 [Osedax symbiont Rs1]|nr:MAG: hypothetical protein OFPII_41150 [Osedax symbiont Rs1]